jgi:hypothetical protein
MHSPMSARIHALSLSHTLSLSLSLFLSLSLSQDGNNDYCEVCKEGGDLVCCDFCECCYHGPECLNSKAEDLP